MASYENVVIRTAQIEDCENVVIRTAQIEDCEQIIQMTKSFADYHKVTANPSLTVERLKKDLFEDQIVHCAVAEFDDKNASEKNRIRLLGYSFYSCYYSSFYGKGISVYDIFVVPTERNADIKQSLFNHIVKFAVDTKCSTLKPYIMDSDESALKFLNAWKVTNHTKTTGYHYYRIPRASIEALAKQEFTHQQDYVCRMAVPDDCVQIMKMIEELGLYQKLSYGPEINTEHLKKDIFEDAVVKCIVAQDTSKERRLIGYVLFFVSYSSLTCKCLFLEDIYVEESHRNKGVGSELFVNLAKFAIDKNCERLDLTVLDWNESSIKFYESKGAVNFTKEQKLNYLAIFRKDFNNEGSTI